MSVSSRKAAKSTAENDELASSGAKILTLNSDIKEGVSSLVFIRGVTRATDGYA